MIIVSFLFYLFSFFDFLTTFFVLENWWLEYNSFYFFIINNSNYYIFFLIRVLIIPFILLKVFKLWSIVILCLWLYAIINNLIVFYNIT